MANGLVLRVVEEESWYKSTKTGDCWEKAQEDILKQLGVEIEYLDLKDDDMVHVFSPIVGRVVHIKWVNCQL